MKISRFEDLKCWQEARQLTRHIYGYCKRPASPKDYRLSDQMTGAAVSIMNNICEGFDAQSNNEFIRFLNYSRRSCSEVQNCLYVALDQSYITESEFKNSYSHCEKIRRIIDGLIRYLKNHKKQQKTEPAQKTRPT